MSKWKMMLYRFMQGRYGNDEFSQFLMIAGIIVIFASNLLRIGLLHTLGWVMLIYAYFRVMSKNISKRQQENFKFLQMKSKFLSRKSAGSAGRNTSAQSSWKQRKAQKQQAKQQQNDYSQYQQEADVENYNYYRCRNCGQIVRVPKGKGTVKITCPECKNTFTDRT
jgi:hypothetical protein